MDSATEPAPAVPRRRIVYNAFLSYSHVADGNLAAALQKALHRFAKQPFRLRAVRVFCDSASLGANPALWPAIEDALAGSEYLILMASPHAAASPWVQKRSITGSGTSPRSRYLSLLLRGRSPGTSRPTTSIGRKRPHSPPSLAERS